MGIYYDSILIIDGPKKARKHFDKRFFGYAPRYIPGDFRRYCFNALYPVPATVQLKGWDNQANLCTSGTYGELLPSLRARDSGIRWELYHYGCIAPDAIDKILENDNQTRYLWQTKSNPAIHFIQGIAFKFPTLTFTLVWYSSDTDEVGEFSINRFEILFNNAFDPDEPDGEDLMELYFPDEWENNEPPPPPGYDGTPLEGVHVQNTNYGVNLDYTAIDPTFVDAYITIANDILQRRNNE